MSKSELVASLRTTHRTSQRAPEIQWTSSCESICNPRSSPYWRVTVTPKIIPSRNRPSTHLACRQMVSKPDCMSWLFRLELGLICFLVCLSAPIRVRRTCQLSSSRCQLVMLHYGSTAARRVIVVKVCASTSLSLSLINVSSRNGLCDQCTRRSRPPFVQRLPKTCHRD